MNTPTRWPSIAALLTAVFLAISCSRDRTEPPAVATRPPTDEMSIVLSLAVLGTNDDGSPKPLPATLGILTRNSEAWNFRTLEDPRSNVFHKATALGSDGLLTASGTSAAVKLWRLNGERLRLWETDFGGPFSRMRDIETGDIYGDGTTAIAVATHDQGVVSIIRPDGAGGYRIEELDRQPNTIVHEIELGDLDGDGVMEVYATPTAPNRVDGTPQPGNVVRYIPARGEGRVEVADLGDRHAKEILVTDMNGDGRDELYVSLEAVSGGQVEILRYLNDTYPTEGEIIATFDDRLCRFLTAGDVDGDGVKEMVAATNKKGLWLLRPREGRWQKELIDAGSSGFEHALMLVDLDKDGRDELYVASDDQREVRRYDWSEAGWRHIVLAKFEDELSRFTWNITAVPTKLIPDGAIAFVDKGEITPFAVAKKDEPAPPAEEKTVPRGLRLKEDGVAPGYVLYAPLLSGTTYLIDNDGRVVHTWESTYGPSGGLYLLENGNLLRGAKEPNAPVFKGGGAGGRIQEISWDGEVLWDWTYATENHLLHHDIERLPNGNILAIAWEAKSAKEANQAGRRVELTPEAGLWPDQIIEIEPQRPNGGRIVWEWHMWDHLIQNYDTEKANYGDPASRPERIDINGEKEKIEIDPEELKKLKALGYVPADAQATDLKSDLLHTNAIHYNAELDQIALSVPRFNEVWVIDHSTTTAEAAGSTGGRWGKGGDLLYRWGNARAYSRGSKEDQILGGQHDIRWIPADRPGAGRFLVFNNNVPGAEEPHSAVYEWAPPVDPKGAYVIPTAGAIGPAAPDWSYTAPDKTSFHSPFISGAERLKNGNTLICMGSEGRIFEITSDGRIVWEYWDPFSGQLKLPDGSPPQPVGKFTHAVFRATRIAPDDPAIAGRDLKPLDPQPKTAAELAEAAKKKEVVRGLRLNTDKDAPGYLLFNPLMSGAAYLMKDNGEVVHVWESDLGSSRGGLYLLENGNLLRDGVQPQAPVMKGGGQAGRLREYSWDGEILWDWTYANEKHRLHHDIAVLPNGNILAIAWEVKTAEEAAQAGRRPDLTPEGGLWPDHIVEIEPVRPNGANIVWEWHVWDHLIQDFDPTKDNYGDPAAHPERIDINGGHDPLVVDTEEIARLRALGYVPVTASRDDIRSDMLHTNAINYNAALDQIVLSVPRLNEIWIIDHSTTKEEAAGRTGGRWGKGGDLLYRWGNPWIYRRGTKRDQKLWFQHDAQWIPEGMPGAGHLLIFNNNVETPEGKHSAVIEFVPPTNADGSYVFPTEGAFGPAEPVWKYEAPDKLSFHSHFISGASRQPNGNTLICEGAKGRLFEVTPDGEVVWEYWEPYSGKGTAEDNPTLRSNPHAVFRVTKIPFDHPALAGRELSPIDPQPVPVSRRSE
jgi:hypothetical protein